MDNTHNIDIQKIMNILSAHLTSQGFHLSGVDATSVLDLLYITYTDNLGRDPKEIQDSFLALGEHLERLSLEENNAIFSIVLELCNAYEKRAFMDAIKMGALVILEVYNKE